MTHEQILKTDVFNGELKEVKKPIYPDPEVGISKEMLVYLLQHSDGKYIEFGKIDFLKKFGKQLCTDKTVVTTKYLHKLCDSLNMGYCLGRYQRYNSEGKIVDFYRIKIQKNEISKLDINY